MDLETNTLPDSAMTATFSENDEEDNVNGKRARAFEDGGDELLDKVTPLATFLSSYLLTAAESHSSYSSSKHGRWLSH